MGIRIYETNKLSNGKRMITSYTGSEYLFVRLIVFCLKIVFVWPWKILLIWPCKLIFKLLTWSFNKIVKISKK